MNDPMRRAAPEHQHTKARICCHCLHFANDSSGLPGHCQKYLNPALAVDPPPMPARWAGEFAPDAMALFCDSYLWAPLGYKRLRQMAHTKTTRDPHFSTVSLSAKFVQYYERGQTTRIRVRYQNEGPARHGYVGISSGEQPVFLLMASTRSKSSGIVLTDAYCVVAVRAEGKKHYTVHYEDPIRYHGGT